MTGFIRSNTTTKCHTWEFPSPFLWVTCVFLYSGKLNNSHQLLFGPSLPSKCLPLCLREKMPFHHVTAGLLYKGNCLSRSLSDSDSDVLASISVEELGGKTSQIFDIVKYVCSYIIVKNCTRWIFFG